MTDDPGKRIVMVLAAARSGTSTVTRGLNVVGVALGDYMLAADERNPKGFWEDAEVNFKVNQGILRELDYPWICQGLAEVVQTGANPTLNAYKRFAISLVKKRLATTDCWGFKDPNTVCVLPFWHEVLREIPAEDSYVIALRNPLSCAYSNIKHSKMDLEAGLLVWLRSMMLAIQGSHGKNRMVVSYDLLLNDPVLQIERMQKQLKLTNSMNQNEIDTFAREFVDKNLQHHRQTEEELVTHPAMQAVPLCLTVYQLLMRIATDNLAFTDAEFHAAWQPIRREYDSLYPIYNELHLIRKACHQIQKDIHKIQQSFVWKALHPLRVLHATWRGK